MANTGLPVSNVVNVQIALSPTAAALRNFGNLLILGDSDVIDTNERLRLYSSIDSIGLDFGSTAPEYLAAKLFFSQSPQPAQCYVGKWARTATAGRLMGAILTTAQQALTNFTSITTGTLDITIDGVAEAITGLDFSSATNLNGVASLIQAKLTAGQTCVWLANQNRFEIKSGTTGAMSTVSFATGTGTGNDVGALIGAEDTQGGYVVDGIAAETLEQAVTLLANQSVDWYGLYVASSVVPEDADYIAAAGFIEATGVSRIMGITTQESSTLDSVSTTDLASQLKALAYDRTFVQYSGNSAYAAASIFGRAFTVDFGGSNTTLTLKFKQEPGVAPEYLTQTQAATLKAKNCNVFVEYNNNTAILQEGVTASGEFFDTIHGTDWFQNYLQTAIYNLLYTSNTKIPQTDSGVNRLITTAEQACGQAVTNGLLAPGVWNAPGFGALNQGDTLIKGFYVYAAPIATQSLADRGARKAPAMQIAAKLAGAIHSVDITVNVNQ